MNASSLRLFCVAVDSSTGLKVPFPSLSVSAEAFLEPTYGAFDGPGVRVGLK